MKWFFGLVLVVALIGGAAYGVGRFLLPNALEVTRSVEIARPRAAVFAMVNDLQIVKEWSPYYARDPDAEYTFAGEAPGAGQSMRWTSNNNRQLNSGRMSIVRSEEYQRVDSIIQIGDRAVLNTTMLLEPMPEAAKVNWSVTAECGAGWINVPCRYMNLVLRGMVQNDLDAGLSRLKMLTEQLPNVDFEDLHPEFVSVDPQAYVYSPVTTSNQNPADVDQALSLGVNQVNDFMSRFSLTRAGHLVRVTTQWDQTQNQMSFRVGYPYTGATPLTVVGVQIGQTPSGRVLRAVHNGPRGQMRYTYAKIYAYLQAHRIATREGDDGLPWEVVVEDGGETANSRIEIFMPLR